MDNHAVPIRLFSKSIIETVSGTSVLSCFVWRHFLSLFEVIQILQREVKKRNLKDMKSTILSAPVIAI